MPTKHNDADAKQVQCSPCRLTSHSGAEKEKMLTVVIGQIVTEVNDGKMFEKTLSNLQLCGLLLLQLMLTAPPTPFPAPLAFGHTKRVNFVRKILIYECNLKLMGMSVVLQVFGHKPKYWTHEHVDLMMAPDEKSEDHQIYYSSSWGEHECQTKFHGNTSSSCWDVSLKTINVNHMVATEKKSDPQMFRY